MTVERLLFLVLYVGVASGVSLVLVGIPAAMLKSVAALLGVPKWGGLVLRSVFWGALVGIMMIALQVAVNESALRIPDFHAAIIELTGWQWTAIGFGLLTAMAIAVDYWMVVRRKQPRLSLMQGACFLMLSNSWVVEGAWLLGKFNQHMLFQSCINPTTRQLVDTFYQPRPAGCEALSN